MTTSEAEVRFLDLEGTLKAIEVQRQGKRPLLSVAHAALLALGIVVTTYQSIPSRSGIKERFELARADGGELDAEQSESARSVILPLALELS